MTPETQTPVERVSDLDGLEALAERVIAGRKAFSEMPLEAKLEGRPDWWVEWRKYSDAASPETIIDLITRLRAAEDQLAAEHRASTLWIDEHNARLAAEAATEEACDVFKLIKKGGGWQAEAASNFLAGHLPSTPVAGEAK